MFNVCIISEETPRDGYDEMITCNPYPVSFKKNKSMCKSFAIFDIVQVMCKFMNFMKTFCVFCL